MSKHTPGPWTVQLGGMRGSFRVLEAATHEAENAGVTENDGHDVSSANARIIAVAPDGLEIAYTAYLALLGHPFDKWRLENQAVLAGLRDYIAKATGEEPQVVQEGCEAAADALRGLAKA